MKSRLSSSERPGCGSSGTAAPAPRLATAPAQKTAPITEAWWASCFSLGSRRSRRELMSP